jgi:hypothetical protein
MTRVRGSPAQEQDASVTSGRARGASSTFSSKTQQERRKRRGVRRRAPFAKACHGLSHDLRLGFLTRALARHSSPARSDPDGAFSCR